MDNVEAPELATTMVSAAQSGALLCWSQNRSLEPNSQAQRAPDWTIHVQRRQLESMRIVACRQAYHRKGKVVKLYRQGQPITKNVPLGDCVLAIHNKRELRSDPDPYMLSK